MDLQDNELCKSIICYLNKAFQALGKNLYVDILFNDINSDQYFEIYSEFNLKRLQAQIDDIKAKLFPQQSQISAAKSSNQNSNTSQANKSQLLLNQSKVQQARAYKTSAKVNVLIDASLATLLKQQEEEQEEQQRRLLKQQLLVNAKHLLNDYLSADSTLDELFKLYAEYYNNLLKPLLDSRELARSKLLKYERKMNSQTKTSKLLPGQASTEALEHLAKLVHGFKEDIYSTSNNIDLLYIDYKQNLIEVAKGLLETMKVDRERFVNVSLDVDLTGFIDILTKSRRNR